MSITSVLFPIIVGLIAPEGTYFKPQNIWQPSCQEQAYFLEHFYPKRSELSALSEKELQCWVSDDYEYLNRIAREHNFDIQLEPFATGSIGSLSILDVMVQWQYKGTYRSIYHAETPYKGVEMKRGFDVVESESYEYPIACISTKSNDRIFMTIADEIPASDFALQAKVNFLQSLYASHPTSDYVLVSFPYVSINQIVDIDYLEGMTCPQLSKPEPWYWEIAQALQQTKFNMDEEGAHVESAVMFGIRDMMACIQEELPKVMIVDKPFYIWIERVGCTLPIFAGYIDLDAWQEAPVASGYEEESWEWDC